MIALLPKDRNTDKYQPHNPYAALKLRDGSLLDDWEKSGEETCRKKAKETGLSYSSCMVRASLPPFSSLIKGFETANDDSEELE